MKKIGWLCLFLLAGCAGTSETIKTPETPEELYQLAYNYFQQTDYERAIANFDLVEQNYPYSEWSERSQIMMAYSQYLTNEYTDAILTLDRFLQLHPGNVNAPYALYLKGLCYYEQMSDPAREQEMTAQANDVFTELIIRYKDSIYAPDAAEKLVAIQNHLAAKELAIGRYYQKQEDYIAAMNRFQTAILNWPNSPQKVEALYRLAQSYRSLGMTKQFSQMKTLMKKTYPDSEWTEKLLQI